MTRRDDEPVFIAEYDNRDEAERAWEMLTAEGIPSAVLSDTPPWGNPVHRVQVARKDAAPALELLNR